MPLCPNCGHMMTSGEECRLQQATGHCFGCYPGGIDSLLLVLQGEEEDNEE